MSLALIASAFWLGILTAISPCPMTTNIAAISFIGRQVGNDRGVVLAGLLYTVGRTVVYMALGVALTFGLAAAGETSRFLQGTMNDFLGPLMILLGLVLLNMIGSGWSFSIAGKGLQEKVKERGAWFAFPVGILFALSFCPVSAALFFGALMPLALKANSLFAAPLLYGIGTALPVTLFAFLIAFGGEYLGKTFNRLTQIEWWIRTVAGVLFILAGVYLSLAYVYELSF